VARDGFIWTHFGNRRISFGSGALEERWLRVLENEVGVPLTLGYYDWDIAEHKLVL
jgi:hypothetical protein